VVEPVERDGQLAVFRELLADAVAGRGRVLLVSGAVAAGKTEMLTRFAELAAEAGARVLTAAAGWAEQNLDMALVEQLFHSTALPDDLADDARRALAEKTADSSDGLTIQQSDARLIQTICAALLAVARDDPLVIVVDDLHFADQASLRTLLYLQRRIRAVRALLVFAEVPRTSVLHDELNRQPHFRQVRLAPLTRAGVGALLARRLGPLVAARLAEPCHALTGGSPLLVHALADDHLAARPGADAGPVAGPAFGRAALGCLRRGDGRMLRLARGIAVLDRFADAGRLARLTSLEPAAVSGLLREMGDAGLLADGAFRHPVVPSAVLDDLPPDELAALRSRTARLLHEDGVAVSDVARYLTAAGAPEPWAFPVLRAAAVEALAHNDIRHAVACLELAGGEEATVQLVAVQWLVDPAAAARHLTPLLRAFEAGRLDDAQAEVLLRTLVWQGRTDDAGAVLARVRPSRTTRDWLFYAQPQLLDTLDDLGALAAVATDGQDTTTGGIDGAEQVLQTCRIGDTPLEDVLTALAALNHADRGDRAAHWCDELLAEAAAKGTTTWQAVLSDVAAGVALRKGDLSAARRLARTALDLMPQASWGVAIGSPLACLLTATTRLGRLSEAEDLVRRGLSPAVLQTRFGLQFLTARGELHLACDRLRAALGDFLAVGELAAKWDVDLPVLVPWRQRAAQVYVRLKRPAQAEELIVEQLALPGSDRTRSVALRVLAQVNEPKARLPLLLEAVDLMRAQGDWFELAQAFADLSRTYQSLGRDDQARMAARRANQLAKACETQVLPEVTDHEEPVGAASLSAAERRVANLAALGHTNREISRLLHVTVSTVEQHLTRTYRKLNISRRTDLPLVTVPGVD
jgi:DNA-binding CsgD family transcriptional regulator